MARRASVAASKVTKLYEQVKTISRLRPSRSTDQAITTSNSRLSTL